MPTNTGLHRNRIHQTQEIQNWIESTKAQRFVKKLVRTNVPITFSHPRESASNAYPKQFFVKDVAAIQDGQHPTLRIKAFAAVIAALQPKMK